MDKLGHIWTSYQVSRGSAEIWKWTGIPENKSIILGGVSGIGYLTVIEILDGYSGQWGFSWGDMLANTLGSASFVSQQLAWKEQRLSVKFSYWPYDYLPSQRERRNQMFGNSLRERILKDYNSQTYWISANIKSFFPQSKIPGWLNISVGYGADGMLGGRNNIWIDNSGSIHNQTNLPRVRHFYLAPDVDLTRIKTNHKFLRKVFFLINTIKFPAPALTISSEGKAGVRAIAF